jgi:hypothetical protein
MLLRRYAVEYITRIEDGVITVSERPTLEESMAELERITLEELDEIGSF